MGIQKRLSWVILLWVLSRGCRKDAHGGCNHLKVQKGLEDPLPCALLTWPASLCRLLAKGFSKHFRISMGLFDCSQNTWLTSTGQAVQESKAEVKVTFMTGSSPITSTRLHWSHTASCVGRQPGQSHSEQPCTWLKLCYCQTDICNNFIFGLLQVRSIEAMECTHEQRRHMLFSAYCVSST